MGYGPSGDTLSWHCLNSVARLSWIRRRRNGPLPPPLDQCHAIPDRLAHRLGVALVEEARLHLIKRREGVSVTSWVFLADAEHVRECALKKKKGDVGGAKGRRREDLF